MRVVVQRVTRAAVRRVDVPGLPSQVDRPERAGGVHVPEAAERRIGRGLVVLAGFQAGDDEAVVRWMAEKCLGLRVFADDAGALNRSVVDAGGGLLVIPNFTLYGDAHKGRRPSFTRAAPPTLAQARFDSFVETLQRGPVPVEAGFFGAHMHVEIVNDGPITLIVERG